MKKLWILGFLLISITGCKQPSTAILPIASEKATTLMDKNAGIYEYTNKDTTYIKGSVVVYPESDSLILFYIDIRHKLPPGNSGSLFGRVVIKNQNGNYFSREVCDDGFLMSFAFLQDSLVIETHSNNSCGFGHGVFCDGVYVRKSNNIIEYFIDVNDKKKYFKDCNPDTYYKI